MFSGEAWRNDVLVAATAFGSILAASSHVPNAVGAFGSVLGLTAMAILALRVMRAIDPMNGRARALRVVARSFALPVAAAYTMALAVTGVL